MKIRNPVVAGSFYPSEKEGLEKIIKGFLEKTKSQKKELIGIVSPHAGYVFCGKTAASVYNVIKNKFETAVVMGPNHTGMGVGVASSLNSWKTPLGIIEPDEKFVNEITKDSIIINDSMSHIREHSIEVQLPWLQYIFKDFKMVPISINPIYFDVKTCSEIGDKIARAVKKLKRKVLMVASSDFTHYGSVYAHIPFRESENVIEKIREIDMEVIKSIEKLDAEGVIRTCNEKRLTVCGYGAIASMIFASKNLGAKKGQLINYSTSFDVSKDISAVVGYAGIIVL